MHSSREDAAIDTDLLSPVLKQPPDVQWVSGYKVHTNCTCYRMKEGQRCPELSGRFTGRKRDVLLPPPAWPILGILPLGPALGRGWSHLSETLAAAFNSAFQDFLLQAAASSTPKAELPCEGAALGCICSRGPTGPGLKGKLLFSLS